MLFLSSLALAEKSAGLGEPTQDLSQEELRRRVLRGESRAELHARLSEGLRPRNEALQGIAVAQKRWREGHRREAFTMMLLTHLDLNALSPKLGEHEEFSGFDLSSGLCLAEMADELGERTNSYEYYRRIIYPVSPQQQRAELRPDILLSYSELCQALNRGKEAKWAFDQIAKGDAFKTYAFAAEKASALGRLDVAERWIQKALDLRPGDEKARQRQKGIKNRKASGVRSGVG